MFPNQVPKFTSENYTDILSRIREETGLEEKVTDRLLSNSFIEKGQIGAIWGDVRNVVVGLYLTLQEIDSRSTDISYLGLFEITEFQKFPRYLFRYPTNCLCDGLNQQVRQLADDIFEINSQTEESGSKYKSGELLARKKVLLNWATINFKSWVNFGFLDKSNIEIVICKSENILRVVPNIQYYDDALDSDEDLDDDYDEGILGTFSVALGRAHCRKRLLWAYDGVTPIGDFEVRTIYKKGSRELEFANQKEYPWYLVPSSKGETETTGKNVCGDGIIFLNHPNKKTKKHHQEALRSGRLKSDWTSYCDEIYKPAYESAASTSEKRFDEVTLPTDYGTMTFEQLKKGFFAQRLGYALKAGLAIHGTNDPGCIGQNITNGCIRMHNEDITKLMDYIQVGTKVSIQ